MDRNFVFNISLSVLNHLGRNLYRNLITVLGEAISNSWDADANNVWITIDRENKYIKVLDDGAGMDSNDFQNKFLKVGYSKRKDGRYKTEKNRPYIGRKGIGKLALLSFAERVHVISKKKGGDFVGGIIDNTNLDAAIADDLSSGEYKLENIEENDIDQLSEKIIENGTCILFEKVNDSFRHTVEYIKKLIALYFKFSLIDSNLNIFVNGEKIDETLLKDIIEGTQFLWIINEVSDPFIDSLNLTAPPINLKSKLNIRGYIASVDKPSKLKIWGKQESVSIDLFVNGRLREKDLLRQIPTSRIVENYVYGQIHFDDLDLGDSKDIFTSSREGVLSDDQRYQTFLNEVARLFNSVIEEWDKLRRENDEDGDPDNTIITKQARKAKELFNTILENMDDKVFKERKDSIVDEWVKNLSKEAEYNISSYAECFIAENLLREYIKYKQLKLIDDIPNQVENYKRKASTDQIAADIHYDIRKLTEDCYYLGMRELATVIDRNVKNKENKISKSAKIYKPIRDAVGHTSIITEEAKVCLELEVKNIKAKIVKLIKNIKSKN